MKRVKVLACVVSAAMVSGLFAGCSNGAAKIDGDKFVKACEKMKLDEFDFEDGADEDDLEDGIFSYVGEDDIEDYEYDVMDMLDDLGLSDIVDYEDVLSYGVAAKVTGYDDFEDIEDPEDIEDVEADGAIAIYIGLDDDYSEDIMNHVEDLLDYVDINTKDLSNKEYSFSKNSGFIRLHIDLAEAGKLILENDDIMELVGNSLDEDDFEDFCNSLKGDVAISLEVTENSIFVVAGGALNAKTENLNSFSSAFGCTNPVKVPANKEVIEDILDSAMDLAYAFI